MEESLLSKLKRIDDERSSFPGEHWLTLGAGIWLLTRHSDSVLGRLLSMTAGAALVCRAAAGRDGLAKTWIQSGPRRRASDRSGRSRPQQRFIDVAAPWPYHQRVRVSAISQPVGKTTPNP